MSRNKAFCICNALFLYKVHLTISHTFQFMYCKQMELKKLISSNCDYSPMIKKSNRESTYLEDLDVKYSLNRKLKKNP